MGPDSTIAEIAEHLVATRAARRTVPAVSSARPLTLADAYAIQAQVTAARLARGERIVGWKLGYTSAAMREQMGIASPNYGPLTDAMMLTSPAAVSPQLIHPKVEPEIAVVLAQPLHGAVTVNDVRDALDHAVTCLEVVDSVFTDYRFTLEDNTADGSSAAQVVLGPQLPSFEDLSSVHVALHHNGVEVARAMGSAASGDPLAGVAWLAGQLADQGHRLEAGDVVITGGLCRAVDLRSGDMVSATFDGGIRVEVQRSA